MSEKENLPEKDLPKNEDKPQENNAENPETKQPAEHIVEETSEEKNSEQPETGNAATSSKENEKIEENNAAPKVGETSEENDSTKSQAEATASASEENKKTEKHNAEQPAEHIVEETSEENDGPKPQTEAVNAASEENKKTEDSDNIEQAMVEESKASEEKKESTATSPEAALDDDDEEGEPAPKQSKDAHSEMEDAVAEDSEDESAGERHEIEKKDYHAMSKEALADELERLLKKEKVQALKEHVEEIRAEFNAKFDEEVEEKKEEFLAEGGNIIDFHYSTPLKKHFNSLYFDYKEKRNKYYQQLKQDLNQNLDKRLEIIEELKGLIDVEENINTTYKHFKDLQDKWKTAGAIPRDKYNTVWNTYHHHVENFYDFLHLNREFRDLDFKHNLEQKLKIISRAEELTQETDTNRAFRELQMLHKMWKEDLGPVEKEFREDIWQKFSDATKKIHDKRQEYFEQLEKQFEKNLEKRKRSSPASK